MGKRVLIAGVIAGAALLPSAAFAQDTTTQVGGTAGGQVTTSTPPVVTSTAQAPPQKVEVKPAETETDHERYIGKFAVGYFGISQLPIALGAPGGAGLQPDTVAAPVVGVRYWINRMIGIDGGIG